MLLENHLSPGNKRITNCLVSLAGKIKPEGSKCNPTRTGGLYAALEGFIFPARLTMQLVIRLLPDGR